MVVRSLRDPPIRDGPATAWLFQRGLRMRELRLLLAVSLAAMTVVACGSTGGGGASGGTKHVRLSFVYATTSINAMVEMALGARAAALDSAGVSFSAVAPPG